MGVTVPLDAASTASPFLRLPLALPPRSGDERPNLKGMKMSILSDRWIREAAQTQGMIEPFVESQRRDGCISYGLSS